MINTELKNLRKTKGLTQSDLAQRSGVSLPTIQNIEAGKANPSVLVLEKILEVFGAQLKIEMNSGEIDLVTLFNMNLSEFKQINLKIFLDEFNQKYDTKKISGRDLDLLISLYSALLDHYPTWIKQAKLLTPINSVLRISVKKIKPNRLIKFRRIWLAKLSQVI